MTTLDHGNDPELDGKYLGTITQDFVKIYETLKEASYQIIKRGFSDYPIFAICKTDQVIGQLLIDKGDAETDWYYFATYLDEFIQRKILDRPEEFKAEYKNPEEYCCLFVIDREFTNFLFIPYPEE